MPLAASEVERREPQPLDMTECIQLSMQAYAPRWELPFPGAQDYLFDDTESTLESLTARLNLLRASLESVRENLLTELTNRNSQEVLPPIQQIRRIDTDYSTYLNQTFVSEIIEYADEKGFLTQYPDTDEVSEAPELTSLEGGRLYYTARANVQQSRRFRNWDIGTDGSQKFIVRRVKEDSIQIVNLDLLYQNEPDFLRTKIARFHEQTTKVRLSEMIGGNLRLHENEYMDTLPAFFTNMARLNHEEQLGETRSAKALLDQLSKMDGIYHTLVYYFYQSTPPFLVKNLSHLAECASQPEEMRQRYELLRAQVVALNIPSGAELRDFGSDHNQRRIEPKEVLDDPVLYCLALEADTSESDQQSMLAGDQDKEKMEQFLLQTGITYEEICSLADLAQQTRSIKYPKGKFPPRDFGSQSNVDPEVFTVLFLHLYHLKTGLAQTSSPAIMSLMQALLPDEIPAVWIESAKFFKDITQKNQTSDALKTE